MSGLSHVARVQFLRMLRDGNYEALPRLGSAPNFGASRASLRRATPHAITMPAIRTAFVFAGGGSLGAAEVGMLQSLVAHGVIPDVVLGSSAGAINAVHFAANPTVDGVDRLASLWLGIARRDVFPVSRLHGALALLGRRHSLLDPMALQRTLAAHLPVSRLEDTNIPCHVVATDLQSGDERLLRTGSALDVLMASAAIPVLFPPRKLEGCVLTDGSVASNTPIAAAIALGATRVVVLPTGFPCAVRDMPQGMAATAVHIFSLLVARQLASDVARFRSATELRIVPPLCPLRVSPSDFSRANELIPSAAEQTRAWIAGGGLDADHVPSSLAPQHHDAGHAMAAP